MNLISFIIAPLADFEKLLVFSPSQNRSIAVKLAEEDKIRNHGAGMRSLL